MRPNNICQYIDHTLLRASASRDEIHQLCDEAIAHDFFSVCLNGHWVGEAAKRLQSHKVKVCTVVGFPLGAHSTKAKVSETQIALDDGADEVDMVMNIGEFFSQDYRAVLFDIQEVLKACQDKTLKVIVESCLLSPEQLTIATQIVGDSGAHFIKTSTGFSHHGATKKAVQIMRENSHPQLKIKASGGIKDLQTASEYLELGVSRIGTSSGITIVTNP